METLLPSFRRELRARAHHLDPVVSIGQHGLTAPVLHEIDIALTAHELIKVRVFSDDREARDTLLARICEAMGCAPVQQIGKLLVLWRRRPVGEVTEAPVRRPAARKRRIDGDPRKMPAQSRRRRGSIDELPRASAARKPAGKSPSGSAGGRKSAEPAAVAPPRGVRKTPGKAPVGVPRAAAPRRRRRTA